MLEPVCYMRPKDHWRIMFQGKAQKTHYEGYWECSHERDPIITQKSWPGFTIGEFAMELNISIATGQFIKAIEAQWQVLIAPNGGRGDINYHNKWGDQSGSQATQD